MSLCVNKKMFPEIERQRDHAFHDGQRQDDRRSIFRISGAFTEEPENADLSDCR